MKKDIHPEQTRTTFRCSCGHEAELISTAKNEVNVEICSNCHPFYTGKQRYVDTAGRIDRFNKKYAKFQQQKKG